eukprot:gene665-480_t
MPSLHKVGLAAAGLLTISVFHGCGEKQDECPFELPSDEFSSAAIVNGPLPLSMINRGSNTAQRTAGVQEIVLDEERRLAFVMDTGAKTVHILNSQTGKEVGKHEFSLPWTVGMAYNSAAKKLYVCSNTSGMIVLDVADVQKPTEDGSISQSCYNLEYHKVDNRDVVYASRWIYRGEGVQAIDVTNPKRPQVVGTFDISDNVTQACGGCPMLQGEKVDPANKRIYTVRYGCSSVNDNNGGAGCQESADSPRKNEPQASEFYIGRGDGVTDEFKVLKKLPLQDEGAPSCGAYHLDCDFSRKLCFVGCFDSEEILTIDISSDNNPSIVNRFSLKGRQNGVLKLNNGTLYTATRQGTVLAMDVSGDPSAIRVTHEIALQNSCGGNGIAMADASGNQPVYAPSLEGTLQGGKFAFNKFGTYEFE